MGYLSGNSQGGGDWVSSALGRASGQLGVPGANPGPAAPQGRTPNFLFGGLIRQAAEEKRRRGLPTPLADRMGWFDDPEAPAVPGATPAKTVSTGVMPSRPGYMANANGGSGLAQLLGLLGRRPAQ